MLVHHYMHSIQTTGMEEGQGRGRGGAGEGQKLDEARGGRHVKNSKRKSSTH